MTRVRPGLRVLDGVLLLDKPSGMTSHAAVQRVLRLYQAAKGGHTGTLDPLATGLLPVCLGEATKFAHLLLDADKTYLATVRLGTTTTTGDMEGEVLERAPVKVTKEQAGRALARFRGEISQIPPMYSALKRDGKPLYKLARAGREVPREPRVIVIRSLDLINLAAEELTLRVSCSKGTYVRVLAEDIGRELGCGGCLSALRREAVGDFMLSSGAVPFEQLDALAPVQRDALLLPADALVASLPRVDLDAAGMRRLGHGQPVEDHGALAPGLTRVYGPSREFVGVAEVTSPGRIVARRLTARGT
jgi:tRNA pseudouridine55 synthase